jgi:hypothetical protein
MSTDFLYLGPVPCDENCAQVGEDDYLRISKIEMAAYVDQLYRMFPEAGDMLLIAPKWFNHDFGRYGEVVVFYDEDDDEAFNLALKIESNLPMQWDTEAIDFLHEKGL